MFNQFYSFLVKKAKLPYIFYSLMAQTLIQLFFVVKMVPHLQGYSKSKALELRFFYGSGDVLDYLRELGRQGRSFYFFNEALDLLYPFAYCAVFLLLITFFGLKGSLSSKAIKSGFILPVFMVLVDLTENFIIMANISLFPDSVFLTGILGYVTLGKYLLLGLNLAAISVFALIVLKKQFQGP